jgi:hypothetical protein
MDVVKRISYFSASIAMFLLLFVLLLLQGSLTAVKAEEIDAKQFVDDAISSNRLVIFSKSYCPYVSLLLVSVNCLVCVSVCVHAFPPPFSWGLQQHSSWGFLFSLGRCCFLHALFVVSNPASCIHSRDRARLVHI